MAQDKKKKKIYRRLRNRYRMVILNDDTFEERISMILSPLNVVSVGGAIFVFLIAFLVIVLSLTPLRVFLPGYSDNVKTRKIALHAAVMADSLEEKIAIRNQYLNNIKAIIEGRPATESPEQLPRDPGVNYDTIQLRRSVEDSLLRDEIESLERFNLYETSGEGSSSDVNSFFFFTPLKGIVSAPFDARKGHHGVDVVAGENEAIKATLDGTVILATWTSETGHVIQVQHANNLVSIYKHNSVLLKKTNDKVKAGEAIAIIGESGENSTGPHLHFELWFNGQPIDPADYMVF